MMDGMELLLLSNSRTAAGFLVDYLAEIRDFAGTARKAAFIPFASVQRPWPEFTRMVGDALQHFDLLKECRNRGLMEKIRERAEAGMPYLGWSAGSNLACPTIKTTNDMPIVDPGSLEALGLLPLPAPRRVRRGQPRDAGARASRGDWLRVSGARIELKGPDEAVWFHGESRVPVNPGTLFAPSIPSQP